MHPDANIVCRGRRLLRYRGAVIGILLIAIIVVEVPKYLILLPGCRGCAFPCVLLCQALMLGFPFFLARLAPTAAGFDRQWLPSGWSQWLWFPGMVLLLLIGSGLHGWLLSFHKDWFLSSLLSQVMRDVAPGTVILRGVVVVVLAPLAEGLFWRGYLLAQLGKLTKWPVALLIHSLLFGLAHLPNYWSLVVVCFFYGTILGIWRIRFRSLLPLVLAHMILNGVASGPTLKVQYEAAIQSYPKCREIDRLTREPVENALPALIAFMADRDEVVSLHALEVLGKNYHNEAEPYLAEALASSDNRTVDRALSGIEWYGYSGLKPQVRAIAWSSENLRIQLAAVMALRGIGDEEGLTDIAQKHPDEKVRHAAGDLIRLFQEANKVGG
jgi:membrane protease YdiL (CAAX protease family)